MREQPAWDPDAALKEPWMKKQIWTATFTVFAMSSITGAALSSIQMRGSDTLKSFTLGILSSAVCPASVGISYVGGGSAPGETAMIVGSQTVAPMSRFLAAPICAAADTSKAEGIAFAAYGVAVVVSKQHLAACQTVKGPTDCSSTPAAASSKPGRSQAVHIHWARTARTARTARPRALLAGRTFFA